MTITAVDVTTIRSIDHREGVALGAEEYRRFAAAVGSLSPHDWTRPTNCEGWTVGGLVGHVVGAMRSAASFSELLSQQKEIKRRVKADGGNEVDHMTALQVERTADLSVEELVRECESLVRPAARGRKRTPAPIRRFARIPVEMGSIDETWTIGYLIDVILTRDIWMHRGRPRRGGRGRHGAGLGSRLPDRERDRGRVGPSSSVSPFPVAGRPAEGLLVHQVSF